MSKALELGVQQALADLPGRGRRPAMTPEARAWVVALACQKPKDLGYAQELWFGLRLGGASGQSGKRRTRRQKLRALLVIRRALAFG